MMEFIPPLGERAHTANDEALTTVSAGVAARDASDIGCRGVDGCLHASSPSGRLLRPGLRGQLGCSHRPAGRELFSYIGRQGFWRRVVVDDGGRELHGVLVGDRIAQVDGTCMASKPCGLSVLHALSIIVCFLAAAVTCS